MKGTTNYLYCRALYHIQGPVTWQYSKKLDLSWQFSIFKINAFSVSMIFPNVLQRQLSITSFIHMSVAVVIWKSKIPSLTNFKIMKLKIDVFSIFIMFFKVLYQKNLWINSFVGQFVDTPLRKCRIPLLTKFTMMKLKIDVFSVFTILL